MKLALHRIARVRATRSRADELPPAFKMLARVARIMEQLVHAWDVLSTLTPSEYSAIRPYLGSSSGFQSWQYREIEFMLGNKNAGDAQAASPTAPNPRRRSRRRLRRRRCTTKRSAAGAPRLRDRRGGARTRRRRPISRRFGRGGVAGGLSRPRQALGSLRAGRRAGRPRGCVPPVALPPCDHGRAHHRLQARHRRHQRRRYLRKLLDVVLFPELWDVRTDL